jgi:hypothetical protein
MTKTTRGERSSSAASARNKSTKSKAAAPDKADETPVDYMLRVMRDPDATPTRRDTMAKSATPYLHARPAAKKKRGGAEAGLKKQLETARETLAGKIAGLRSDCDESLSG